jgi:peptidyl-prolyl cis-trans isomerase A (cyclophilin A)
MRYIILGCAVAGLLLGCKVPGAAPEKTEEAKTAVKDEAKPKTPDRDGIKPAAKPEETAAKAPDQYTVKLKTTKGDILVDVTRAWAPKGADRFYELVESGYFSDVAFFRVVDGFMAQVGIHGDPEVNVKWRTQRIEDDPVEQSNTRGMLSFATSGRNSRTTQFFVNFGDNSRLDRMGFAPFGKVRDMKVVDSLYNGYGEGAPRGQGPSQRRMQKEGNAYLKAEFPKLDYLISATVE